MAKGRPDCEREVFSEASEVRIRKKVSLGVSNGIESLMSEGFGGDDGDG